MNSQRFLNQMMFHLLNTLSKQKKLFSERRIEKFSNSAKKRHPFRGISKFRDRIYKDAALANMRTYRIMGGVAIDDRKQSVLLICHDASKSGAPILGVNMAATLSEHYNVFVYLLANGQLVESFLDVSSNVIVSVDADYKIKRARAILDEVSRKVHFHYCIANSATTCTLLPQLRSQSVPTIALVHEFASYLPDLDIWRTIQTKADEVVFSSQLTLSDAAYITGFSKTPRVHVIAQGKSEVPREVKGQKAIEREHSRLDRILGKKQESNTIRVLGAGTIEFRKGVDLFLDVARLTLERVGGKNIQFYWVGKVGGTDADRQYYRFVSDQVRRCGLQETFCFIEHTDEFEHILSSVDFLLMTSRLDPLPNVCIDAIFQGKPVLCFDKACGFAEALSLSGISEFCVSPYLNTSHMADNLVRLIEMANVRSEIGATSKLYASNNFSMETYVAHIAELGEASVRRRSNVTLDTDTITKGKTRYFDQYVGGTDAVTVPVEQYVLGCLRRPEPGFNPHVFAEQFDRGPSADADPYAGFIRRGRPQGPWKKAVLEGPFTACDSNVKAALHIHAYYPEMLEDIVQRLCLNESRPDLFISVMSEADVSVVERMVTLYSSKVTVRIFPNIGRDIGPFLTGFMSELTSDYEVVGHVHTKKSLGVADAKIISSWREFLYENTLGGAKSGAMIDGILSTFAADPKLGLVYPSDPNLLGWNSNEEHALRMAGDLGIGSLPQYFDFPVGTMFWMRADVLRKFASLDLQWSSYPREPVSYDGTMLHALERLFGIVPEAHGFKVMQTVIPGVSR